MHTATLLHDDVVDESDLRRGRKTARMIWGNQASVLVGDFLLGQAFRMMVDVGSLDALDILSTAASIIAEGEVMQLAAAKNLETTEDEHFAVIKAKTAALFSAAAEVGPVIAGASRTDRAALRSYGMNLGLAFQLIDDALDYGGTSKDLGKNVGDDFREGKVTLAGHPRLPSRHPRRAEILEGGDRGQPGRRRGAGEGHRPDDEAWRDRRHDRRAPAISAASPAMRWRRSKRRRRRRRCSTSSISASAAWPDQHVRVVNVL